MFRAMKIGVVAFALSMTALPDLGRAEGWGEQQPLQFKNQNNQANYEVLRHQLGALGTSTLSGSGGGLGGSSSVSTGPQIILGGSGTPGLGQSSTNMNNSIQQTSNPNIIITGDNNIINLGDSKVGATQSSTGTQQTGTNQ